MRRHARRKKEFPDVGSENRDDSEGAKADVSGKLIDIEAVGEGATIEEYEGYKVEYCR